MKALQPSKLALLLAAAVLAVTSTFAQTITWTGGSGTDLSWNNPLNWSPNQVPVSTNGVVFDNFSGVTNVPGVVNNQLATSITVSNLVITAMYNDLTLITNYHATSIGSGRTLTISGPAGTLLTTDNSVDDGANAQIHTAMTNGGHLVVGNVSSPNAGTAIQIGKRSATGGVHRGILDLSGLDSFTAGVQNFYVGGNGISPLNRDLGTLILAGTNVIRSLTQIRLAHSPGNQGSAGCYIYLGQENSIYTDDLHLGRSRGSGAGGVMQFRTGLVSRPTVKFRAGDTTGRMGTLAVGDNGDGSGTSQSNGTWDMTGGNVDGMVSTMIVARTSTASSGTATATATYDGGYLDISTLHLGGNHTTASVANSAANATGTLNVRGNAALTVGTLNIGRDGGAAGGTGIGTLNVESTGTILVTGSMVENNAAGGNGTSTVNITNATMSVGGNVTVDNLSLTGSVFSVGGLATLNNLTVANTSLKFTLGPSSNTNTPLCSVTNFTVGAPVTLNVAGGSYALGQYPVIRYYGGVVGGDGLAGIIFGNLPSGADGYFTNNVAANSIDVVITNFYTLKWDGNVVGGNWDINVTPNWLAGVTPHNYLQNIIPGDTVYFDDTASGTTTINVTTNVAPSVMTMTNSVKTYAFRGTGGISGPSGWEKHGSASLVISNTGVNDFAGNVNVHGGLVQLGGAPNRIPTTANVTLDDVAGVGLDLGNQDDTIRSLSGGGLNGGNVNLGSGNLTVGAGATYAGVISGTGKFLKTGSGTQTFLNGNTYSGGTFLSSGSAITVLNTNGHGLGTGNIEMSGGTLNVGTGPGGGTLAPGITITNHGTVVFNTDSNITLAAIHGTGGLTKNNTNNTVSITGPSSYGGATAINEGAIRISSGSGLGTTVGATTIPSTMGAQLELLGNITVPENFGIGQKPGAAGLSPHFLNISGTNTLTGTITGGAGGSYWAFRSDGGKLIVNGGFVHNASAIRYIRLFGAADGEWFTPFADGVGVGRVIKHGTGTWTIWGVQTYSGNTYAHGGNLVINGEIQAIGGTVFVGEAGVDFACTLSGTGLVYSAVLVDTNGIFSPGNSIGTMTLQNNLTMAPGSTTVCDVNTDTLEHDFVTGVSTLTYGGTLVINPIGLGTAITNGASVQLFSAASYAGAFDAIVPAVPGPGLSWNTSQLTVSGTLGVMTGPPTTPTTLTFGVTGNQLNVTWPASHTGWRLQGQTNSAAVGLSTNWFTVPGSTTTNHVILPVDAASGAVFYRLVYP